MLNDWCIKVISPETILHHLKQEIASFTIFFYKNTTLSVQFQNPIKKS